MLHGEPETMYEVYPSWADFSYKWEDLPRLLSDPLASPYTDRTSGGYTKETKVQYWKDLGFPTENIEPAQLIGGPSGGGIVSYESGDGRWLPGMILIKEANCVSPMGMDRWARDLNFNVFYLEPYERPFWDALEGRPRTRLYLCNFSVEHIESDPEAQYWVLRIKRGRREVPGLNELAQWAFHFNLHVYRLPGCPQHLTEETADWFDKYDQEYIWYKVENFQPKAGLCFAIVVYLGLHLAKVAGKRLRAMHMLAGIEGKPNICKHWGLPVRRDSAQVKDLVQSLRDLGRPVTAMVEAACYGAEDMLRELLASGISVNQKDERGVTALMGACIGGQVNMVHLLLEQGADVNVKDDRKGNSPLMWCLRTRHSEEVWVQIATALLKAGADAAATNRAGETPLKIARRGKSQKLITLLESATAC